MVVTSNREAADVERAGGLQIGQVELVDGLDAKVTERNPRVLA